MSQVWFILELMLAVGAAIFLHELGHFLAARWAGVRVHRFSIGFPPRLFGFTRGHTDYCVSAIPVGGYVKLAGEEWDDTHPPKSFELMAKPWWKRIVVYSAGVTMNLVFAFVLFFSGLLHGLDIGTYTTEIAEVVKSGAGARAGFCVGDRVVAVAGTPVANWDELGEAFEKAGTGKPATFRVRRDGRELELVLTAGTDPGIAPLVDALIGTVAPMSPARKAGVKHGDRIVAIGGSPVRRWADVSRLVTAAKSGVPLALVVEREGAKVRLTVTPELHPTQKRPIIGISPMAPITIMKRFSLWECTKYAVLEIETITVEIPRSLWQVVTGKTRFKDVLGGPVLIARLGMEKAEEGIWELVHFLGALNVQLMTANLLPIPVLDGGAIVLALLEGIRRKRFSMDTYQRLTSVGLAFLLVIVVLATYHDIRR